jgi:hypothetical protein
MKPIASCLALCCLAAISAIAQPRFTGYVGGGPSVPLNPIASRIDTGWNVSAGAGVTGRQAGILLNFIYNENAINQGVLNQIGAPNGSTRIWGFTLDPVVHLNPRREGSVDFYITGGGGIYHRTVEFTQPAIVTITAFDPWFGAFFPADVLTNQVIGSYSVYKGGVDGGAGLTFKLSSSSNLKLFAEAKFHHIFTNRVDTNLIPVTIGLRW